MSAPFILIQKAAVWRKSEAEIGDFDGPASPKEGQRDILRGDGLAREYQIGWFGIIAGHGTFVNDAG
jgi:hypothetical protein